MIDSRQLPIENRSRGIGHRLVEVVTVHKHRVDAGDATAFSIPGALEQSRAERTRLKREARSAEKYKRLSAEIRALQSAVLFSRWSEARDTLHIDPLPARQVHQLKAHLLLQHAGVVDQYVEATKVPVEASEQLHHLAFIGYIGLHGDGALADALADTRRPRLIEVMLPQHSYSETLASFQRGLCNSA